MTPLSGRHGIPGRQWSRRWPALAALLLVFAVAGCGALPIDTSVSIERSLPGGSDAVVPPARVLPPGPAVGADPAAVVAGFLAAQADADADYSVAREFLAPGSTWPASGAITVYDTVAVHPGPVVRPGGTSVSPPERTTAATASPAAPVSSAVASATASAAPAPEGSTTVVRTALSLAASLDAQGAYTPLAGSRTLPIRLRVVNGQWRIADVGAGVLLTLRDLERSYEPETLWWLAPNSGLLVPDVRWFSATLSSLPTTLVKALLAGPRGRLAGVVRSAIPAGTQLRGSATVISADVLVDFDRTAAGLSRDDARAVLRQLVQTLGQVPTINAVRLTVDGQPVPIPGLPTRVTTSFVGAADPDRPTGLAAYAPVASAGAVRVGTGRAIPAVARLRYLTLDQVASSPDGQRAAGLVPFSDGTTQVYLATPSSGPVPYGPRGHFVSMSFDATGALLVVSRTGLVRYDGNGHASSLVIDPVSGGPVGVLDRAVIAPSGVRVALIAGGPGARRLWLGELRTETNGVHLTDLQLVAPALGDVRAVSWVDSADLAALAAGPDQPEVALWQFALDGSGLLSTSLQPAVVGAPDAVTTTPGAPLLVGAGGRVYARSSSGFRQVAQAGPPSYPG